MNKHTPSPWAISKNSYGEPIIYSKAPGQVRIAKVLVLENEDALFESNAQLIAAAPDLLAACEAIIEENPELSGSTFSKLYEAVKKAKPTK